MNKSSNNKVPRKRNGNGRSPSGPNSNIRVQSNNQQRLQPFPVDFAPVSLSQRQGTQKPSLKSSTSSSGDLRVRVKHREYVGEILGSVAYAVTSYSINPGLASSFPWLAQLAVLFESYQFHSLVFQYRTQAATSATGKALLSVDWDAADAAPGTKVAQLQERTKMDDAAWKNFDLPCDLMDLRKFGPQRFVRGAALSANLDIKTYDVGNLLVGTQGQANANAIGELWAEYDLDLMTPQPSQAAGAGDGAKIVAATSISDGNVLGNAPVITGTAGLVTAANNTIIFNKSGSYLVDVQRTGTGLIAMTISGSGSEGTISTTIDAAATGALSQLFSVIATPGQTLILDASGDTTVTATTVRIAAVSTPVLV